MICDKMTENHHFTITTNTSQHVEFFHSLILLYWLGSDDSDLKKQPIDLCTIVVAVSRGTVPPEFPFFSL